MALAIGIGWKPILNMTFDTFGNTYPIVEIEQCFSKQPSWCDIELVLIMAVTLVEHKWIDPRLAKNLGSSSIQQPPATTKDWVCHVEWFDVEGCSLGFGPMLVSPPPPPTRSPPVGTPPNDSSMSHDVSSRGTPSPNPVSEDSERSINSIPSRDGQ